MAAEAEEEHSYQETKAKHGDNDARRRTCVLGLTVSGTLFTPQMFVKRGKVFYLYQEQNVNRKDKEGRERGGGSDWDSQAWRRHVKSGIWFQSPPSICLFNIYSHGRRDPGCGMRFLGRRLNAAAPAEVTKSAKIRNRARKKY